METALQHDRAPDGGVTAAEVNNARYIYFGLRPRTECLLGAEPCQIPDCPKEARRSLTIGHESMDVTLEIVLCDAHADRFYEEEPK